MTTGSGSPILSSFGSSLSFKINFVSIPEYTLPTITYQWYKDGVIIPGAIGIEYSNTSATSADAGIYSVIATGPVNVVDSGPISVVLDSELV